MPETPSKSMNERTNTIIDNYFYANNTDYAILINGDWGCGKTYYINHELKEICKNKKMKYIYISLYGCKDFDGIRNTITCRLLTKTDKIDFDENLINNILSLGSKFDKLNAGTAIASKAISLVAKPISKAAISKIGKEKIVIIFDDLERISLEVHIKDILGDIYENYAKNGYKTIIVADEKHIVEQDEYKKIKEKVIGRTILYDPDKAIQLNILFSSLNTNDLLLRYQSNFIFYIKELNISNLRTVLFALNNFTFVMSKLEPEIQEKFCDVLFKNILVLSNEYKEGNITLEDLQSKKGIDKIDLHRMFLGFKKVEHQEIEKSYINDFYNKYIESNIFRDFAFINSIYEFILTGYLDSEQLISEIKKVFYYEFYKDHELVQCKVRDWKYLEADELKDLIEKLIGFIKENKYPVSDLMSLYFFLKNINKKYPYLCNHGVKKLISDSFFHIIQIPEMLPHENKYYHSSEEITDSFYLKMREEINKIFKNDRDNSEVEKMNNFFIAIKSNEPNEYIGFYEIYNPFSQIIEMNLENEFLKLNIRGIHFFISFIKEKILRISNAGEYGYPEKTALEKILSYIQSNLHEPSLNFDEYKKARLIRLTEVMKTATDHIENTKRKN